MDEENTETYYAFYLINLFIYMGSGGVSMFNINDGS